MKIVNMHEAKTNLSDLVARAEAGEEIIIARRNKPAARLLRYRASGEAPPPVTMDPQVRVPGHDIQKDDIAAYYGRFPREWDDMVERVDFGESEQAGYDLKGLREAVEAGREFTIMIDGKPVAKVAPVEAADAAAAMGFGMLAHLRGVVPDDLFVERMSREDLERWTESELP